MRLVSLFITALVVCRPLVSTAVGQERAITVAVATSAEETGFFRSIMDHFEAHSGIRVRLIVSGTSDAIETARQGNADVLFVDDPISEKAFMDAGFGRERREIMYNYFVIVGPASDPADVQNAASAVDAFRRIAMHKAPFVSRADQSSTNLHEKRLWQLAGIDSGEPTGSWYREYRSGTVLTLVASLVTHAYTLIDKGTWISFRDHGDMRILLERDPLLFNQYSAILVNPDLRHHTRDDVARALIDWLTSAAGQREIAAYKIMGEPLFTPNAKEPL